MKKILRLIFMSMVFLCCLNCLESKAAEYTGPGIYTQIEENSAALKYTNADGEEILLPEGLTKYDIEIGENSDLKNEINEVENLYGRYQFNYTGTGNSQRGFGSSNWGKTYISKLSTLPQFSWIDDYIDYSLETGKYLTTSGAALLEKLNNNTGDTKVYKAYLTVAQVGRDLRTSNITLIGPNGKYIQTNLNEVYGVIAEGGWLYHAGFIDITEFIKDQGYGWYYCGGTTIRPYEASDRFSSWRIVVIEEGEDVPVKNLKLYLGGRHWKGSNLNFQIENIISAEEGKGQLLYFIDGSRDDEFVDKDSRQMSVKMYNTNNEETIVDFYEKGTSGLTYEKQRMRFKSIMEMMTKYGEQIKDIRTYDSELGTKSKTYNGRILKYNLMGGDSELLEFENTIGDRITKILTQFHSTWHMLFSGVGLAIDLDVPTYDADITTSINRNGNITITGSTSNTYLEDPETGLTNTTTVINIDENINVDGIITSDNKVDTSKVNLEIQNTSGDDGTTSQGYRIYPNEIDSITFGKHEDGSINYHQIIVNWGHVLRLQTSNVNSVYTNVTLYKDKIGFQISGLKAEEGVNEVTNEVYTSGNLFANNAMTNQYIDKIAYAVSHAEREQGPELDLSLRQFVSSINRDDVTHVVNREPIVDVTPLNNGKTTANYEHSKEILAIKEKDIISYTIRIYNEGDYNAYADEVTVHLPDGLEFISSFTNKEYGWSLNGANQIQSNLLISKQVSKFNEEKLDYVELKLECQVSDDLEPYTLLTNLAEITKSHAIDDNGEMVTDIEDRDSQVNNYEITKTEDDTDYENVQILLMDIQGKAWVDEADNSQTKIQNMLVRLTNVTDEVIDYRRTDNTGYYIFKDMPVNKVYKIEFEYDGQTYAKSSIEHDTTKYTNENEKNRQELNDRFYEVTPIGAKNKNEATSVINLPYNTRPGISELDRNTAPFNKGTKENGIVLFADMSAEDYNSTRMKSATEELAGDSTLYYEDIDLALTERQQLQLEVYSDLTDVTMQIKGKSQTYNFSARDTASRVKDEAYNSVKYSQGIYPSDYEYRKELYQGKDFTNIDELEIYATYYIKIYNASTSPAQISELAHYYDETYEYVKSGYSYNGEINNIEWIGSPKFAPAEPIDGYKLAYTTSFGATAIEPGKQINIAVMYKVSKDENRSIKLGEKKVATEINSYTSEQGLIDMVSKPGNVSNAEKDTDIAPILNLELNDKSRQTTGMVWEEAITHVINGVKKGDGIYDNTAEAKINNIEVQLIEKLTTTDNKQEEFVIAQMSTGNKQITYVTNTGDIANKDIQIEQGEYLLDNILPGNYIIRFTYGGNSADFTYNGQDYKSTQYKVSGERVSDAKDNEIRRKELMELTKTMTNEMASILANPRSNEEKYIAWAAIYADTESMSVEIEHDNNITKEIDLGLVKRPQTKLQITKEIQDIKLVKQGQSIIDTSKGIVPGVLRVKDAVLTDIYRSYMISMDDELLTGAELTINYKIVVKNIGDIDNLANYFDYDPNQYTEEEYTRPFKTSADIVYDYSNSLLFEEQENWGIEENYSILAENVQKQINSGKYTVLKTGSLSTALAPGESAEVGLELKRVVSAADNNMEYFNEVEIVQRTNEAGRRDEEAIPGNYVPGDETTSERDNWDTDLTITTPTGRAQTYYELILICAVILLVGIILIKKYVLNEK